MKIIDGHILTFKELNMRYCLMDLGVKAGSHRPFVLPLCAILAFSILAIGFPSQKAFADGFTTETFSASFGNRQAELLVKVNPPILTDASRDDAYILLRLYDANNNQTIKFTTFSITVEKGVGKNAEKLFTDAFHTESGLLQLKVQPTEGEIQILGTQEQFLNAWVADPGGTVNIRGPMFLEGGVYHLRIDILGIDSVRNLFPPDKIIRFDSWLSVGDVFSENVQYQGQPYNMTIISYYDRVQDFAFDASKQQFTWAMPFDWNVTRIQSTNIFVHEEVKIPKSLEGIGNANSFAATVNDNAISGRKLAIDPYSSEQDLTLHYLLNKDDIISLAGQVAQDSEKMTFALSPATGDNAQTTGEMVTDTGGIGVAVQWTPNPLNADGQSTVKLDFSDGFSGGNINSDVVYDLKILDKDGKEVYSKIDQTAKGGTSTQTIDFPSNERYRIEVTVKGLIQDGRPVDQTRNGVARGIVIVPEFPVAIAAGATIMALAVGLGLFNRKWMVSRA